MSAQFWPCPGCSRHVKRGDAICPFCGATASIEISPTRVLAGRLSRAALFAAGTMGAAVATTDCSTSAPQPTTTGQPAYGGSPYFPNDSSAGETQPGLVIGDGGLSTIEIQDSSASDGPSAVTAGADAGGTVAAAEGGSNEDGGVLRGDSTGPTAARVTDFLDSIGVCVHIAQGVDDPAKSATAMAFAGIRELRDDGDPSAVSGWITVFQQAGVRTNFIVNPDLATTLSMAKQLHAAGALLSVEGPNEPNNFPVTYMGATSSSTSFVPVAELQRDLYSTIKEEPTLVGIPVFHSSEAGGSEPDNVGLQFLTIPADAGTTMPAGTTYADYANTHNYVCGHSHNLVDNVCWNATSPTLNGDWDGMYVEYGRTWNKGFAGYSDSALATLPRVSTETGWTTMGTGSITPEQQARVFLNLYLAAFAQGWTYTFIYMLRDDPMQGYWGLFDTSYDAKTSGTYLHNMTTIFADTGSARPGKLHYTIAAEPATVHDLLFQKSDGTFELVVWDERPAGGSDAVTVDLEASRAKVTLYDPTMGTAPMNVLTQVSSVMLTLTDHPVILEL
jgi:hypothetical protein